MTYIHTIGIDVSKNWFDYVHFSQEKCGKDRPKSFQSGYLILGDQNTNDDEGIKAFIDLIIPLKSTSLVILEPTGGYETLLMMRLLNEGFAVHRVDTAKSKKFLGGLSHSKTDSLDARGLAYYGYIQQKTLALSTLPTKNTQELKALLSLREDYVLHKSSFLCRRQHPSLALVQDKIDEMIEHYRAKISEIDKEIASLVAEDDILKIKKEVLVSMKGFGETTAHSIVALLPEIGTLNKRQIASLAGVAPKERTSGMKKGKSFVFGGRNSVKRQLYTCAMSARQHDAKIKAFYEGLVDRGKPKVLAMVAVMRKMIVIANAKIRDKFKKLAEKTAKNYQNSPETILQG